MWDVIFFFFTICPNFGGVSRKHYSVLCSFENNLGGGDRVFSCQCSRGGIDVPKSIQLIMLIFAPVMIFLATSLSILLRWLIVNKLFSFVPCHTKLVVVKYILQGHLNNFLEVIKPIYPLLVMISH